MKTFSYIAYSITAEVLYVGITKSLDQRLAAHQSQKKWWGEVDSVTIKSHSTREEAESWERFAISDLQPKYNALPGVKTKPARRLTDKLIPTSRAKLPKEEIEYLKTLNSEETYARCAELQKAGWSVTAMLEGAKVSPTPVQLRTELKYKQDQLPTGVTVPTPPKNRREEHEEFRAKYEADNYLSEDEKDLLKYYSTQSKKYRPQYGVNNPIYQAVEEYKELITQLRDRGVFFSTIAAVVGVSESNIRRRYIRK
jgi:hypothetical protein